MQPTNQPMAVPGRWVSRPSLEMFRLACRRFQGRIAKDAKDPAVRDVWMILIFTLIGSKLLMLQETHTLPTMNLVWMPKMMLQGETHALTSRNSWCFETAAAEQSAWLVNLGITGKRFSKLPIWRHKLKTHLLSRKLTCPLKNAGWKAIFPLDMVPFQVASSFSGGYDLKMIQLAASNAKWKLPSQNMWGIDLCYWFGFFLFAQMAGCSMSLLAVSGCGPWVVIRNSLRANGFRLVNHASPMADHSLKRNPR